jgi:Protein of unknown function (DUF2516)
MPIAVPQFYGTVIVSITWTITVVTLVLEVVAFLHCLLQRSDAFSTIGTLSKGLWLALIGGSTLFVLLGIGAPVGVLAGMFTMIPVVVALVYLLDIRPAIRDAVDGHGSW